MRLLAFAQMFARMCSYSLVLAVHYFIVLRVIKVGMEQAFLVRKRVRNCPVAAREHIDEKYRCDQRNGRQTCHDASAFAVCGVGVDRACPECQAAGFEIIETAAEIAVGDDLRLRSALLDSNDLQQPNTSGHVPRSDSRCTRTARKWKTD
eukprot:SAG31_NODE_4910_length_2872_cov_2.604039_1_plen_150_part_00